jgi:catechol 2,3-dioxygenase-like lactoylglutathione lyase family enzyme
LTQRIASLALVVRDYDEAIDFYTRALRFELIEDTRLSDTKRWVVVAPPGPLGAGGASLVLARAATPEQVAVIGRQAAGRVWLFLHTTRFDDDLRHFAAHGVQLTESPRREAYGRVVVFLDLYGNRWDLIEAASP